MKYYIYFLIDRKKVVYVGQTRRFGFRLGQHTDKEYNEVRRIECPVEKLAYYEKRWIVKFKPKYNKSMATNFNRNKIIKVDWVTLSVRFRDKTLPNRIKQAAELDNRGFNNFLESVLQKALK